MSDEPVTRKEHEEFAKRIDDENTRQNRRIAVLEEEVKEIHKLTLSVERLAVSMENMMEEIKKQTERLDRLEKEPAEAHKQIKMSVITALIGAVVGAAVTAVMAIL